MRQNDFLRTRRHGVRNQVPSSVSGRSRPTATTSAHVGMHGSLTAIGRGSFRY